MLLRWLLLSLLAAGALVAQAGGLFLWEADKAGQRVWLLGSIHLGQADFYPLPAPIEAAYQQAAQIAVEADVSEPGVMTKLLPLAMLPAEQTLGALLTSSQNRQLDAVLQRLGLPRLLAERMKPWFLALSLSALDMQAHGFLPQYGVDMHFLQRAKRDGKAVLELESAQAQFALLDGLPMADALAVLDATLAPIAKDELKPQLDAMLTAWRAGDTAAMQQLVDAGMPTGPAMRNVHEQLFTRRNRAMSEKIAALAAEQAPLVIVGAGHLVGPDSVLALLQTRGFRIKQY